MKSGLKKSLLINNLSLKLISTFLPLIRWTYRYSEILLLNYLGASSLLSDQAFVFLELFLYLPFFFDMILKFILFILPKFRNLLCTIFISGSEAQSVRALNSNRKVASSTPTFGTTCCCIPRERHQPLISQLAAVLPRE